VACRLLAAVVAAGVLGAAVAGCGRPDSLAGFAAPRMLRLAPDGRLLVTDLGTGRGDGRVVAVDLAAGRQEVLLDRLPSTRGSGQQHADLAGPSGAAMAPDGTVCVAIGDATRPCRVQHAALLRRTGGRPGGLRAGPKPDGRELASNPYDVVWDGGDGWYVSDAAANAVLHVDRAGHIRTVAVLANMAPFGGRPSQGVPTAADGTLYVALFGGAPATSGPAVVIALRPTRPAPVRPDLPHLPRPPAPSPPSAWPQSPGGWRCLTTVARQPTTAGAGFSWSLGRTTRARWPPPAWTGRSAWPASPTAATWSPRPTPAACGWSPLGDPPAAVSSLPALPSSSSTAPA
jgi:hypothetical protein